MGDSYDDKIETILVTRKRMAEQRRIQRQKELQKQLVVLVGALVALIIVIVLIFNACSGKKETTPKDKVGKETTAVEPTTVAVEEATSEEDTTVQEETTTEGASEVASGTMYTTDILNFRTEPSVEGDLIRHLDKGTEVQVISTENGWCQIKYGDHTGYVSAEYLSATKPE